MDNTENIQGDQRKFERRSINITITYQIDKPLHVKVKFGDEEIEATTLDLSEAGMAIVTQNDIPVSTLINIEFMIHESDQQTNFTLYKSIKVKGEVKSNNFLAENKHRLGIHFRQIEDEDKKELARFVNLGLGPKNE